MEELPPFPTIGQRLSVRALNQFAQVSGWIIGREGAGVGRDEKGDEEATPGDCRTKCRQPFGNRTEAGVKHSIAPRFLAKREPQGLQRVAVAFARSG